MNVDGPPQSFKYSMAFGNRSSSTSWEKVKTPRLTNFSANHLPENHTIQGGAP
jgi:hypothetical protein